MRTCLLILLETDTPNVSQPDRHDDITAITAKVSARYRSKIGFPSRIDPLQAPCASQPEEQHMYEPK